MTEHSVQSESEWNALMVTTGDTVSIDGDFTFTSQPTTLVIGSNILVEGNGHTLSLDFTGPMGIFEMAGGTVQNVIIDGLSNSLANNAGGITDDGYGTIKFCR